MLWSLFGFRIGIIVAVFHLAGKDPKVYISLYMFFRHSSALCGRILRNILKIRSGPGAKLFEFVRISLNSSGLNRLSIAGWMSLLGFSRLIFFI